MRIRIAGRLILLAVLAPACVPRPVTAPAGPGTPRPDHASVLDQAIAGCRQARTLSAELSLSGRVGQQKVRGRVLAGLGPEALRLEGVAPFGSPFFVFVARGRDGTLLLPRDGRVLASAPPADILRALAGISRGPDDLRFLLAGCLAADLVPVAGRGYGTDEVVVDLQGGGIAYLRRRDGRWRLAAGDSDDLTIEYARPPAGTPQAIRIRSARGTGRGRTDVDLSLTVRQLEINGTLGPETFVVRIPENALPLTLGELEAQGPLGVRR